MTFVILAAGRGSRIGRVGESLHKCLVPLEGRAIISHLFDLAPPDADVIVCVGHKAQQVKDYVALAHPDKNVTFVDVAGWDQPGGGPGHSLLATRDLVRGDLAFTSCDTLWEADPELWAASSSWTAVAPMPVGTTPERWCRIVRGASGRVIKVLDKTGELAEHTAVYTGLSFIKASDLDLFWDGVQGGEWLANERQVSGGLAALASVHRLDSRDINWTDVGDATAYHRAVIERQGYDWTKEREATWVLPETGRVVKFWADEDAAHKRVERAAFVQTGLPHISGARAGMIAYNYVSGQIAYDAVRTEDDMRRLLRWADRTVWRPVDVPEDEQLDACKNFYYVKTIERIAMMRPALRQLTMDAIQRIDWSVIVNGCDPVRWHGDFNLGNIISHGYKSFVGIDWRGDFAGHLWGDSRYDIAKLIVGCRIHWERAMRGDFRPWPEGKVLEETIRRELAPGPDIDMIAALTLLNSAPLHSEPLDEVLVVHAANWLEHM